MPQDMSSQPLARITPVRRSVVLDGPGTGARAEPSPREKAAIIVRFLLAEGATVPVSTLPEHMQAALTEQMGKMRLVDRGTLAAVVEEFLTELEEVGLSFPGGIDGALAVMDGHISPTAANRLRRLSSASGKADPWDQIVKLPADRLLPVLLSESTEVGAVMLSKMPVNRSAELLGKLPGERARRTAYAMSMTSNIDPETVRRIGQSLASQLDAQPARAFESGPADRVGAILNAAPNATREDVLQGLEAEDSEFAMEVRRRIFTFDHIPTRLEPRDVPKVVRMVPQDRLVTAMAFAGTLEKLAPVPEFLLSNLSQRLGQSLRDEVADRGSVKEKDGEEALTEVLTMIRQLESAGEIALITPDE